MTKWRHLTIQVPQDNNSYDNAPRFRRLIITTAVIESVNSARRPLGLGVPQYGLNCTIHFHVFHDFF